MGNCWGWWVGREFIYKGESISWGLLSVFFFELYYLAGDISWDIEVFLSHVFKLSFIHPLDYIKLSF